MKVSNILFEVLVYFFKFFSDMATITLDLGSPVSSEGDGPTHACAVIGGLPKGGLGTAITVLFSVSGDTAGM